MTKVFVRFDLTAADQRRRSGKQPRELGLAAQ